MNVKIVVVSFIVCILKVSGELSENEISQLKMLPGHLKPFGSAGPFFNVPTVEGFLSPQDFFNNHVVPSIPVVMKGAAKLSVAYEKWTDEYFLEHSASSEGVYAESKKKEVRTNPGDVMKFHDFIKQYKKEELYMVNGVPKFLQPDVLLPFPLKCNPVLEQLADTVMWFSSGGTRSVLHNDDVDNINCLYRGNKTLTFVSPFQTDQDWLKTVIDHPEGTYSDVDVDAVDYVKYPSLAKHKYGVVEMKQGDCLFIPYKWAHQVNSFGNNLAVNVWFNHLPSDFYNMTKEQCGDHPDDLNLSQVSIQSSDPYGGTLSLGEIVFDKDYKPSNKKSDENTKNTSQSGEEEEEQPLLLMIFKQLKKIKPKMDIDDIKAGLMMMTPVNLKSWDEACNDKLKMIFQMIDKNSDSIIDKKDLSAIKSKGRKFTNELLEKVDALQQEINDLMFNAQQTVEQNMIKKLVIEGHVDYKMAENIYGDKFLSGIKPIATAGKDEL